MADTEIYFWTDRSGYAYARLRHDGGHWRLEWGYRDPPGSDNYVQRGEHQTSVRADALRLLLGWVRAAAAEPDEAQRVERELHEALPTVEA